MSKVSFCFSNNSEVSRISLWVWWVSLFSSSFFTVFNNWFLIRRHISLSGLDLSHIQHITAPVNLHRALWLICASCIICPIMINSAKVKIIKKITCIWREWGKNICYFEKKWPLLKMYHEVLAVEKSKCPILHGNFFLYILLQLCQGMKVCDFMHFVKAKWERAEISPPPYSFG